MTSSRLVSWWNARRRQIAAEDAIGEGEWGAEFAVGWWIPLVLVAVYGVLSALELREPWQEIVLAAVFVAWLGVTWRASVQVRRAREMRSAARAAAGMDRPESADIEPRRDAGAAAAAVGQGNASRVRRRRRRAAASPERGLHFGIGAFVGGMAALWVALQFGLDGVRAVILGAVAGGSLGAIFTARFLAVIDMLFRSWRHEP